MASIPPVANMPNLHWIPPVTFPPRYPDPEIANPGCNEIVVCVVCGVICTPTVPSALSEDYARRWMHPWLVKAKPGFLERRADPQNARESRFQEVNPIRLLQVVKFSGGASGFGLKGGKSVAINTNDPEMYIPIHSVCFELTEIFCEFRSSCDFNFRKFSRGRNEYGIPCRMDLFYEIWMQRARRVRQENNGVLELPISEQTDYLGILYTSRLEIYNDYINHCWPAMPVQQADPSPNEMATTLVILKRLVLLHEHSSKPDPAYQAIRHGMENRLPIELTDMIIEKLRPFYNLTPEQLTCTRALSPSWWKKELLSGKLIPWLFDIDEKYMFIVKWRFKVERPGEPLDINKDLDWELLCRQLGQKNLFEPGGILFGEKKLENRWRIWRLLDGARLEPDRPEELHS
ncbi:uncharacterized protein F4817DRAFT_365474 [Daldinia loculata]|uniref:uncharacterized protein n=1 Tax=Daldinia loculata TaxID=103429 RepID=UPI0020C2F2ED|nr:uncharacterized protein F4817DRAFT_365474 [Daldinia loculata]KAI1647123.1 hypothetical protein F4817DRAFT_365474 [Daldinia loculata]